MFLTLIPSHFHTILSSVPPIFPRKFGLCSMASSARLVQSPPSVPFFSLAFILQCLCFSLYLIDCLVIVIVLFFFLGSCVADCLHCWRLQVFFTWASGGLWRVPSQIEWGFSLSHSLARSLYKFSYCFSVLRFNFCLLLRNGRDRLQINCKIRVCYCWCNEKFHML